MKALIKNEHALVQSGVLVYKPYINQWGFHQSKTINEIKLYDWVYKCLVDGFSVQTRVINGKTYILDGGNTGTLGEEIHWLIIPMRQFNIPSEKDENGNTIDKNKTAFNVVSRVCTDNQELLIYAPPADYYSVVNDDEYVDYYKLQFPFDQEDLIKKRKEILTTISEIDLYVISKTGFSVLNKPTTNIEKVEVISALHDWILENVSNNTVYENSNYWTHNAYNCLKSLSNETDVRTTDCSGFASAYQMLCQRYGVNCIQVIGGAGSGNGGATTTKINHSWNILSLELPIGKYDSDVSKWYAVDLRFDEYVKDGKVKTNGVIVTDTRRYFMTKNIYSDTTNTTIKGRDYRQRANNDIGYPVEVTSAYY